MKALAEKKTPKYLQQLIDNYLMDRILLYNTAEGYKEYEVTAGVPQGSILGPFLWNVMYDGLLELTLPEGCLMIGFADDVALVVTARTTSIIELLANESLRRASGWFRANGLELALQKTEAVLITDKRLFTPPVLSLEGEEVKWKRWVKYLGVHLDAGLRYTEQAKWATEKAASTAAALTRLMPNIGGPSEGKRRLLNSVMHSKMLYGAEIWGEAIERGEVRRKMASVQRRGVQRVISAYRTVSKSAALVLASTPPIDLLIRERQEIYSEYKGTQDPLKKRQIKKAARDRLFVKWQERWDTETTGRWTYTLIPKLKTWCKRDFGKLNFHLTQAFTGHGCFNDYLVRMGKRESAACLKCGLTPDNAHHAIFQCVATEKERRKLESTLGEEINENNIIKHMITDEERWLTISSFVMRVVKIKESLRYAEEINNRG